MTLRHLSNKVRPLGFLRKNQHHYLFMGRIIITPVKRPTECEYFLCLTSGAKEGELKREGAYKKMFAYQEGEFNIEGGLKGGA